MRRKNSRSLLIQFLAAILVLACASALPAQKNKKKDEDANSRSLQGTVLDPDGNPSAQAAVQLKDTRTLQVLSFITKEDGMFHFTGLKTDTEYEVRAEREGGFSTDWKRISVFDPRKIVIVTLKLQKKEQK